jgi:MFS family permease
MEPSTERRDSRLLVGAVGLSAAGDFLALIPLVSAVQALSESGFAVSGLFIALWGPLVLFAPLAGRLVDRVETRRLLIVTSLAQAVVALALLAATDSVPAIIALVAVLGSMNAIAQPAEFSLAPAIASASRVKRLNGHVETARYLGLTIGPIAGGALGAAGGIEIALAINAATFVAVAIAAALLHVRREPLGDAEAEDTSGGLALLRADPLLRLVMVVTFLTLLIMTGVATAEVFYVRDDLDGGDFGYGLVMSAWTLGMAAGALLVSTRIRTAALASAAMVMIMVQGAGLSVQTIWLSLPFAVFMYLIGGIGHGTKNVLVRTLIHERVPARAHGRAGAAYNALRNGAELGALALGGVLVESIGARGTLALQGGIPILIALGGLIAVARMGDIRAHPEGIDEMLDAEDVVPTAGVRGETP